ncbi:MAG: 2-C-methyl-D-erythritol 4-phosphate cytidylyltransferase [Bdellovibrionota bacterium]
MQRPSFSIVLCCGGSSTRFRSSGANTSKQFFEWDSRPLFIHSLKKFEVIRPKELALVVPSAESARYEEALSREKFSFEIKLTEGGARRQDSVRKGLEILNKVPFVGIHDGARPFLSEALLDRLLLAVEKFGAVIPVLSVVETLKQIESDGLIKKTYDRSQFVRAQTPQFFSWNEVQEVHQALKDSKIEFTDDSMMFEHLGLKVYGIPGDAENLKVTSLEDLSRLGVK